MKNHLQETRPDLWHYVVAALMIACMLMFGCKKQALETTSDGDFEIEFLFEKDGVRMYRFTDNGVLVYFWSGKELINFPSSVDSTFMWGDHSQAGYLSKPR